MERLTKGLYGTEFRPTSALFDISCGQKRRNSERIIQRADWYNKNGEKIGWGDLSVMDFIEIARGLNEGEIFVVLPGGIFYGDLEPEMMALCCSHVVCGGYVYFVGDRNLLGSPHRMALERRIWFYVVPREMAVILVQFGRSQIN